MEHVVFYTGHDGSPSFRRVETLNDAVSLVEYLRNTKNAIEPSVFALTPVPVEYRPYFRAEVPAEAHDAVPVAVEPIVVAIHQGEAPIDVAPEGDTRVDDAAEDEARVAAPHISLVPDLAPLDIVAPAAIASLVDQTHSDPQPFAPLGFEPIALHADTHITVAPDIAPAHDERAAQDNAPAADVEPMTVPSLAEDPIPLAPVVQLHVVADIPADDEPVESPQDEAAQDESAAIALAPIELAPVELAPVELAPVELAPVELAPVELAPVELAPVELVHAEPAHDGAAPIETVSDEPAPVEAAHEDIAPIEAQDEAAPIEAVHELAQNVDHGAAAPDAPVAETGSADEDHLDALAELAAQVAEDTGADTVEDDAVAVRYDPESFSVESEPTSEAGPHDDHETTESRTGDVAEPELAEQDDSPAAVAAQEPAIEAHEESAPIAEAAPVIETAPIPEAAPIAEAAPVADAAPTEAPRVQGPVDVFVVPDDAITQVLAQVGAEQPDAEPVTQEPALQEPAVQEPAVQEPAVQEAAAQAPVVQEPVALAADAAPADTAAPADVAPDASPAEAPAAAPAAQGHGEDAIPTRPHIDTDSIPPLTEEELAAVSDMPMVPVARGVSPEATGRREGARSLGFFAR